MLTSLRPLLWRFKHSPHNLRAQGRTFTAQYLLRECGSQSNRPVTLDIQWVFLLVKGTVQLFLLLAGVLPVIQRSTKRPWMAVRILLAGSLGFYQVCRLSLGLCSWRGSGLFSRISTCLLGVLIHRARVYCWKHDPEGKALPAA